MKKFIICLTLLISSLSLAQLSNGLILHYNFNNQLIDQSTSNIVLTNNGCTFVDDRNTNPSSALELSNTDYLSTTDQTVKTTLPITISAWVKVNSFAAGNILFRSDNEFNNNYGYWINTGVNTGHISVSIGGGIGGANSSNRRTFKTDMLLQEGVWTHLVCIIRDYNDMSVYFDCVKSTGQYTGNGPTNMVYSNSETRIGSDIGNSANPNGTYYNGGIDDFAIWNRELSESEFLPLCDRGSYLSISTEKIVKNEVVLYPIPSQNTLNFEFRNTKAENIKILSPAGNLVRSIIHNKDQQELSIDVSNLSKGSYFVVITDEKGQSTRKKFIKL
jgi:hypothetical protein